MVRRLVTEHHALIDGMTLVNNNDNNDNNFTFNRDIILSHRHNYTLINVSYSYKYLKYHSEFTDTYRKA